MGLPCTRFALHFSAWETFDNCPEVCFLGGRGDISISGPTWNIFAVLSAGVYVIVLCCGCWSVYELAKFARREKARLEKEKGDAQAQHVGHSIDSTPPPLPL